MTELILQQAEYPDIVFQPGDVAGYTFPRAEIRVITPIKPDIRSEIKRFLEIEKEIETFRATILLQFKTEKGIEEERVEIWRRLTAESRRFAGHQVRCQLNRRAAVATSLRTPPALGARRRSTREKNPHLPYGRPIEASEVGSLPLFIPVRENQVCGTHGSMAESLLTERSKIRVCSRLPRCPSSLACLS
jgi:hypothetical protein